MFENARDLAVQLMPAVGIALIIAALVMRMRRRRRGGQAQGTAREQLDRFRQERGLRGDLDRLMVEIEQMAKRLGAQLDAKTIQLERLLDQADARIAELRELDARRADRGAAQPVDAAANPPTTPSGDGQQGAGAASAAATGPAAVATAASEPPGTLEADPLTRRVYDLADRGEAPDAIARQLDEHIGKIELILALRQA